MAPPRRENDMRVVIGRYRQEDGKTERQKWKEEKIEERPTSKAGRISQNASPDFFVLKLRKFNFLAFRNDATDKSGAKKCGKALCFKLKYRTPAGGDFQRVLRYSVSFEIYTDRPGKTRRISVKIGGDEKKRNQPILQKTTTATSFRGYSGFAF